MAQRQNLVAVAWYTGIEGRESVQVGFSNDGGQTFPIIRKIDSTHGDAQPIGRPTIALLRSGDALVVWITRDKGTSHLVAAQVSPRGTGVHRIELSQATTEGLGYPRLQILGSDALVSWAGAGDSKQIRTALLRTP